MYRLGGLTSQLRTLAIQRTPHANAISTRNVSSFDKLRAFLPGTIRDLVKVRRQIEGLGEVDEQMAIRVFRSVSSVNPKECAELIEKGWYSKKLSFSEEMLKEYLKAVAGMGRLDAINMKELLALSTVQRVGTNGVAAGTNVSASSLEASIPSIASGEAGSRGFGGRFRTAGSSPSDPLYIAQQEPSFRSHLFGFARTAVGTFLLFALVSAFLDDKIGGAAGGISSRLGGSSIVHQAEKSDKTFEDVVGIDEAKAELEEIVMYLKDPKKFTRLGGKLPKGILLTGPPGTGKTLLARAIAGEAKVPFFHASGSEFEEMYVGVGAKRVRELFDVAKAKSPCIIFIDEIDAIGGSRHIKDQSAMKMTLNQLLVEMDGFAQNNGIIVIAATNFPDSLDNALIRPGRFDKHVDVSIPDIGGRKAILELYAKKVPMEQDVDLDQLSRGTPGFSGAELFNLINQAALKASVDGLKAVNMAALEYAKDKILMGAERRSAVISPETMRMTAFHEAGHALVALKTGGADPVHKATIMPRGRALGMVMQLPEGDQTSMSRAQMLARLDVCMGGRVAEELIFGKDNVTSGASNDIMQASRLARAMVTKYGLSDKVGVVFYDEKTAASAASQGEIDKEVKDLLTASYDRAKVVLSEHRNELDLIAKALMEYESLSGSDIVEIMEGRPIDAIKRCQKPSKAGKTVNELKHRAPLTTSPSNTVVREPSRKNQIREVEVKDKSVEIPLPDPTRSPSVEPSSASGSNTSKPAIEPPSTGKINVRGPPKA
eukprot:gene6181-6816_t